jgi:hypothetical protein
MGANETSSPQNGIIHLAKCVLKYKLKISPSVDYSRHGYSLNLRSLQYLQVLEEAGHVLFW